MHNLLLFLHVAAAIFWMGGMAFMVLALRPALHELAPPPQRLPLIVAVLRRFFVVVIVSIVVLLLTGIAMLLDVGMRNAPPGFHAMAGLGLLMMLVFGHVFFVPWRRLQRAVAAQEWPVGGKNMGQITLLVKFNL